MTFSVYRLKFRSTQYYIGSSNDPEKRFKQHKYSCLSKKPQNIFMSRCWKKYGEPKLEVLMHFDSEQEMLEYEQVLITKFIDDKLCLNLNPSAKKPPGLKGKKHTKKAKEKMSVAKKGKSTGPKSLQTKQRMSNARYVKVQVGEVVYASMKEAAKALSVAAPVISQALKKNYKVKGLEVRKVE